MLKLTLQNGELPQSVGINYFFVFDLDNQLELDNWAFGRRNVNVTQFPAVNATDGRGFCAKLEKCIEMAGTVGYGWARLLDVDELYCSRKSWILTLLTFWQGFVKFTYVPLHGRLFASKNRTYQPIPVTTRVREFFDMNWTKYLVRLENWTEGQRWRKPENYDKPGVLAK